MPDSTRAVRRALGVLLTTAADCWQTVPEAAWRAAAPASAGGHVRHGLDHVAACCTGIMRGRIDYEDRRRGTSIEHDPLAAAASCRQLAATVAAIDAPGAQVVQVGLLADPLLSMDWHASTVARELSCVHGHLIHHHALVVHCLRGVCELPPLLWLAPATRAHTAH
jgi:hypothetical protein